MKPTCQNILFLLLVTAVVFTGCGYGKNNVNIAVTDTDRWYEFSAHFSEDKTARVQRYINKSVGPDAIFTPANSQFDNDAVLADSTRFHLQSSAGNLAIRLNKQENSGASYKRVQRMCEGIREIIAGK